jgi:hypothetical protein
VDCIEESEDKINTASDSNFFCCLQAVVKCNFDWHVVEQFEDVEQSKETEACLSSSTQRQITAVPNREATV